MPFLNQLKNLLQIGTDADFAHKCKKEPPNMANYLNRVRSPGPRVLEDCLLNATVARIFHDPLDENSRLGQKAWRLRNEVISTVIGREIRPSVEVEELPERQGDFPESSGVYVLYDSSVNVLYVGKASNFRNEVWTRLDKKHVPGGMRFGPSMRRQRTVLRDLAVYMSLYEVDNEQLRHNLEALLIRVFVNQTHNSNIGRYRGIE